MLGKGLKIGTEPRLRDQSSSALKTPAPNHYKILGDFDFENPNDPESIGKKPKFAFGLKTEIRDKSIDIPGPGTYANVFPAKNQNYAYWIGTDVRRDPAIEKAHLLPGPGSYIDGVYERKEGPYVSFTQEKKKVNEPVVQTDEPGPGSYYEHHSVGVLPEYARKEVSPFKSTNDASGKSTS